MGRVLNNKSEWEQAYKAVNESLSSVFTGREVSVVKEKKESLVTILKNRGIKEFLKYLFNPKKPRPIQAKVISKASLPSLDGRLEVLKENITDLVSGYNIGQAFQPGDYQKGIDKLKSLATSVGTVTKKSDSKELIKYFRAFTDIHTRIEARIQELEKCQDAYNKQFRIFLISEEN